MRTSTWVVAGLAVIAVSTASYAGPPCLKGGEQVGQRDDRLTTREVERRIATDETVAHLAPRVRVSTSEGVVTLSGMVASVEDRLMLASLAESAPGVRHVEDRMEVGSWRKPPSASRAR